MNNNSVGNYGSPSDEGRSEALARATAIASTLFPHQVEGVAFLLGRRRAILADDMGLGKTRQAIIAMVTAEPEGPYLVVCPASVKRNWSREIEMAIPGAKTTTVSSTRLDDLQDADWVVINYDLLGKFIEQLGSYAWKGIIFDEAHYIKNHKSQRSTHARTLASGGNLGTDPVVYALTGTPMSNRPRDLFPLLQLTKHPMAKSFLSFAKRYCNAVETEFGWNTDGASNLDELAVQLTGVMLRRAKHEVLALPPKIRSWNELEGCEGTGGAEVLQAFELLSGSDRGATARGKLVATLTKARQKIAVSKVKSTIEFVQSAIDQGEKVLVFTSFDQPAKMFHEHFGNQAVLLTGATPTDKRQELVDQFQQQDKVKVFVANIVAGGVGLNLTAARQVVFNDLDWVPANHWQAEDRAYRLGQTETVNVTYQVAFGTIDEFVRRVLQAKALLVEAVIERKGNLTELDLDVMGELERVFQEISPQMADADSPERRRTLLLELLRNARSDTLPTGNTISIQGTSLSTDLIALLANALSGPKSRSYRMTSSSKPGLFYRLDVDMGGDVICSCPGFEYRGACSHSRALKTALATGSSLPPGLTEMLE